MPPLAVTVLPPRRTGSRELGRSLRRHSSAAARLQRLVPPEESESDGATARSAGSSGGSDANWGVSFHDRSVHKLPDGAGADSLVVSKPAGARLGLRLRPEDLVLLEVERQGAAALAGAERFVGRKLTHVGDRPVGAVADVLRAAKHGRPVVLRFAPRPPAAAGRGVPQRPEPAPQPARPERRGSLDPCVSRLLAEVEAAERAVTAVDSASDLTGAADLESQQSHLLRDTRSLVLTLQQVGWTVRALNIAVDPDQELGIHYKRSEDGPLWVHAATGPSALAGLPAGALLVRIDNAEIGSGVEAEAAVLRWREKARAGALSGVRVEYVAPSSYAQTAQASTAAPPELVASLGTLHDQDLSALVDEAGRELGSGPVRTVRPHVAPGQQLGILYQRHERGPLWCRRVFGPCAEAGLPVGAVLVRIDGCAVPDGAAAERAVSAWRARGSGEIGIDYISPQNYRQPEAPQLHLTMSLGEGELDPAAVLAATGRAAAPPPPAAAPSAGSLCPAPSSPTLADLPPLTRPPKQQQQQQQQMPPPADVACIPLRRFRGYDTDPPVFSAPSCCYALRHRPAAPPHPAPPSHRSPRRGDGELPVFEAPPAPAPLPPPEPDSASPGPRPPPPEAAELLGALEHAKAAAVAREDYLEAKRLKAQLDAAREAPAGAPAEVVQQCVAHILGELRSVEQRHQGQVRELEHRLREAAGAVERRDDALAAMQQMLPPPPPSYAAYRDPDCSAGGALPHGAAQALGSPWRLARPLQPYD
eukprot:TRINITY_DN7346_c0_g5_i1.p1 TRINITY_DN7346_c0_g5~~TRINITY_DN7346_c0_g5_i1.p1  ORF type:complete len:785 (+),score=294.37 TRINITY_DN7346_c0_g5_i1:76-2355(+)